LQEDIIQMVTHLSTTADDSLALPLPRPPVKQGDVSAYYQTLLPAHFKRTAAWRATHDQTNPDKYALRVLPKEAAGGWLGSDWEPSVDGTRCVYSITGGRIDGTLCLTADAVEGALVRAVPCYPSANAEMNRDPRQSWRTQATDGTLRPTANLSLCVTNTEYRNTSALPLGALEPVLLQLCDQRVQQYWAYHGKAPGDANNGGWLYYGDDLNALGVVKGAGSGGTGFSYFFNSGQQEYVKAISDTSSDGGTAKAVNGYPKPYGTLNFPGGWLILGRDTCEVNQRCTFEITFSECQRAQQRSDLLHALSC
jgi:hypothetical protein